MAWYDFIAVKNLDTSLTDEESASSPLPDEEQTADLAPCPAQYFELFEGLGGGVGSPDDGLAPPGTPTDLKLLIDTLTALVDRFPLRPDKNVELQSWIDQVNLWAGTDWEKWIDDTVIPVPEPEARGARGDTGGDEDQPPATIPPQLPDLIDFISLPTLIQVFGPWGVVVYVGLKIVKRLLEAHLEKPGVGELVTILEKAVLFDDGNDAKQSILKAGMLFADIDGKQKGVLDRGLIVTVTTGDPPVEKKISILELMKMSLDDLAFVDAIIDFGAFRCHIRGKMIEY